MSTTRRTAQILVVFSFIVALLAGASAAWAHPHTVTTGNGGEQEIANGQNHPPFVNGVSCDTAGTAGPAWYGLESAHHGPDAGDPGRGDGCYETTGNVAPGADDENPAID